MDHNLIALELGTFQGPGPLGNTSSFSGITGAANLFAKIFSTIIGVMTIIAFLWFIVTLFLGAISWLSSGGEVKKVQEAQKQITTSLTGLLIVVFAIFLVKIIELLFGISILNISGMIVGLW